MGGYAAGADGLDEPVDRRGRENGVRSVEVYRPVVGTLAVVVGIARLSHVDGYALDADVGPASGLSDGDDAVGPFAVNDSSWHLPKDTRSTSLMTVCPSIDSGSLSRICMDGFSVSLPNGSNAVTSIFIAVSFFRGPPARPDDKFTNYFAIKTPFRKNNRDLFCL